MSVNVEKLPTIAERRAAKMQPEVNAGQKALAAMSEAQTFASQHLRDTQEALRESCDRLKLIMDNAFYHDGIRARATMIHEYLQKELSIFGTQGGS